MNTPITVEDISARIRNLRIARSLSLQDVETLSGGSLNAAVLGSYERGARSMSIRRAIQLANLYEIPLQYLLTETAPIEIAHRSTIVLDLRKINRRAQDLDHTEVKRYQGVARVVTHIVKQRQDWNGEVLSIRQSDLETISIICDISSSELVDWLKDEKATLQVAGGENN